MFATSFLLLIVAGSMPRANAINIRLGTKVDYDAIAPADNKDSPEVIIKSEECAPLRAEIVSKLKDLLSSHSHNDIVEYACNSIQRDKSKKREAHIKMDIGVQKNECFRALEELMTEDYLSGFDKGLDDPEECDEVVGNALRKFEVEEIGGPPDMMIAVSGFWDYAGNFFNGVGIVIISIGEAIGR